MKQLESDELAAYRERARAWLAAHAPRFCGAHRKGLALEDDVALSRAWQALKAENGYACITMPKAYGGAGGTEMEKSIFAEEELAYDVPTYHVIGLSNPLPMFLRYASEQRRREIGPPSIRGDFVWCQLFSEPAAGSDLAALRLRAVKVEPDPARGRGEGWVLNGQKLWTSWAHIAKWGVLIARTDPAVPKHAGLTYFYLDMQSPGISIRPIRRTVGKADVCEVYFDDVFVPDDQRMGRVGEGFKLAIETLMIERYAVMDETANGTTLEQFVELARVARINAVPALEDGQIRAEIARVFVERQGLRSINRRAMAALAAGREPGPEGGLRKLLAARTRQRLGALALDLLGAEGVYLDPKGSAKTDFAWSWLDPSMRVAGGTDEILLSTLAERVLGLPQDHRPDKGVPFNQLA
jgi:alkylation response protein AidB-like acyl-CoA dehydrogenase